ncbi:MAG TPA: HAMP domain-containing sensor histidine kinase [Nitrososphaeraceae archaeon]|nr:HAMP domain-containing sensor histidine kinase [Nitrososphaeraceae archaeon]
MYGYNEHPDDNNKDNSSRIDKKFLDALSGFIQSVELEMDIVLPRFTSLQFLSYYKIIDYIISQKLSKNIIIKMLCSLDEDSGRLTKQLAPFIGYKSIKLSLPKTSANSSLFIRDKRDIFSFSVNIQVQQNDKENKDSDTIFYVNDWSYSKNFSTVRNTLYCFDIIWEEKEAYDKIIKEKRHSELLFDVISHDIGNYYQIIRSSLELVTSLFEKSNNNTDTNSLSQNTERILLLLTTAKNALTKSQSLVDNIRRLERLYAQKDLKLILKNLPDVINNAYTTVEQTLYDNNPQGKRIRFSVRVVEGHHLTDINVIAEDLLEEIFINLFSNSVKYTDSSEVKIDVLIRDYFIGELKYWMITVSDYGKGIQDLMKKDLFERFYSKAKGSGLGLSIVKTLVERYKGKIWVGDRVYEDYTQGTTFGMIFPAA